MATRDGCGSLSMVNLGEMRTSCGLLNILALRFRHMEVAFHFQFNLMLLMNRNSFGNCHYLYVFSDWFFLLLVGWIFETGSHGVPLAI